MFLNSAPPKVANTRIIGELREGSKITVTGTVSGGTEGSSRVQWFKSSSLTFTEEDGLEALSTSKIAKVEYIHCLMRQKYICIYVCELNT